MEYQKPTIVSMGTLNAGVTPVKSVYGVEANSQTGGVAEPKKVQGDVDPGYGLKYAQGVGPITP